MSLKNKVKNLWDFVEDLKITYLYKTQEIKIYKKEDVDFHVQQLKNKVRAFKHTELEEIYGDEPYECQSCKDFIELIVEEFE